MRMAFDLDGVLVDTKEANRQAYLAVDVRPPGNFHVIPWQHWVTKPLHDAKNKALPQFADLIKPLRLLELLEDDSLILSNCSDEALALIRSRIPQLADRTIYNNMIIAEKANFLNRLGEVGLYLDDSQEGCAFIKAHTRWTTCRIL